MKNEEQIIQRREREKKRFDRCGPHIHNVY